MPRPLLMLDTHICIYIQRQKPAHVLERFQALNCGEAVILEKAVTHGRAPHPAFGHLLPASGAKGKSGY
jgi:hypothetical protein